MRPMRVQCDCGDRTRSTHLAWHELHHRARSHRNGAGLIWKASEAREGERGHPAHLGRGEESGFVEPSEPDDVQRRGSAQLRCASSRCRIKC
jgi:hypothetical protein